PDDDRERAGSAGGECPDRARDRRRSRGASVGKACDVEALGKLVGDRHAGGFRGAPVGGPEREGDGVSDRNLRRAGGLSRDEIRVPAGRGGRRWRRRWWWWCGQTRDVDRGGGLVIRRGGIGGAGTRRRGVRQRLPGGVARSARRDREDAVAVRRDRAS